MNQSNITYVYHAQSGVQRLIFSALERVMQDLSYRTLIWAELRSKPQDKKFFKIFEGRQNLFKSVFAWRWPIFTWNVRSIKSGKISDFGTKPVNMGRVWSKNYLITLTKTTSRLIPCVAPLNWQRNMKEIFYRLR